MIEIDGMTWDIINPLIKKNQLPNIDKLIRSGSYGILKSIDSGLSPSIWTSIVSGKSQDKHGINDFAINSMSVKCKRIWDIFTEHGLRCGIFGHLVTWPPPRLDCFSVPDFLAQDEETYPPDLCFIKKLAMDEKNDAARNLITHLGYWLKSMRYGMRLLTSFYIGSYLFMKKTGRLSSLKDFYRKRIVAVEMYSDIFAYLYKKTNPDFAIFYTNVVDACCHQFWKFMDPEKFDNVLPHEIKKYGHITPTVYKKVDQIIGKLLSQTDKDTTVIVLSDHGFQAASRSGKAPMCIIQSRKLIDFMVLSGQVAPTNLAQMVYLRVYNKYRTSQDKIIEMLKSVRVKEADTPLFDVNTDDYNNIIIRPSGEAYVKLQIASLKGKYIVFNNSMLKYEEVISEGDTKISGIHHVDGVLIIKGPHIMNPNTISNAHVFDITPTLLALKGMAVAKDMDGKVLTDAIEDQFFNRYPITYIDTYESADSKKMDEIDTFKENEEVIKRLRELGYVE